MTPAFADEWRALSLARERVVYTTVAWLTTVLVPAWLLVDALLEREHLASFAALRAADVIAGGLALYLLPRARTLEGARALGAGKLFVTGAVIAPMLPLAVHGWAYACGFSLVLLGAGALLAWPMAWSALCFGAIVASTVVANAFVGRAHEAPDTVAVLFYLSTVGIVAAASVYVRRRLELRAFRAGFELAQKNRELGEALETLRETQARLGQSEKLAALGRLLAGLSHEINNPLNVIHNNLEPLRAGLDALGVTAEAGRGTPKVDEAWRRLDVDFVRKDCADALTTIGVATQRIQAIHRDLRQFIRGESPVSAVGDPLEGLAATVAMLRRGLPPAVRLRLEGPPLPPIAFQSGPLNQVFFNLVKNALDAVGSSGEVVVTASALPDSVRFAVADDGPGVPEPLRERIFEPFFTTKVGRGTGLGLAICHQIVQAHGGRLELDGAHAPGARFVVTLPR